MADVIWYKLLQTTQVAAIGWHHTIWPLKWSYPHTGRNQTWSSLSLLIWSSLYLPNFWMNNFEHIFKIRIHDSPRSIDIPSNITVVQTSFTELKQTCIFKKLNLNQYMLFKTWTMDRILLMAYLKPDPTDKIWHHWYSSSLLNPEMTGSLLSKCDFIFWCYPPYVQYFYMKLVQYNECLVSIVDTDGLVL